MLLADRLGWAGLPIQMNVINKRDKFIHSLALGLDIDFGKSTPNQSSNLDMMPKIWDRILHH